MKKKKILITFVTIMSLVLGNLTRISAYADFDPTKSRGNFVLGVGEMAVYASDLDYLQSEVQALYDELPSVIEIDASAMGAARKDSIRSKGIIDYGNGTVVLDSSDFNLLADEIDSLEFEYKANTVAALNRIGTYFMIDGSVTHNQGEETLPFQYANILSLDMICAGIQKSQSVDHLAAAPAIADNISVGAAAWVDGRCIIGNGKDVNDAYNQGYDKGDKDGYDRGYKEGYEDGYDQGYDDGYRKGYADGYAEGQTPDNAHLEYIYHEHIGDSGIDVIPDEHVYYSSTDPQGCYKGNGHTHNKGGSSCVQRTKQVEKKRTITDPPCTGRHYHDNSFTGTPDWYDNCVVCPSCKHDHTRTETYYEQESYWDCNGDGEGNSGQYINTWIIDCGKSTSTMVGATIVWDD